MGAFLEPKKLQIPNKIILHCADTPDDKEFGVEDINAWHMDRGFNPASNGNHCGYHYVILRNGVIEQARPDDEKGVHCKGYNTGSIAICWIGRHEMTEMQHDSLEALVLMLLERHNLRVVDIYGHKDFNAVGKTCPNFDSVKTYPSVVAFRERIAQILDESQKGGSNENLA